MVNNVAKTIVRYEKENKKSNKFEYLILMKNNQLFGYVFTTDFIFQKMSIRFTLVDLSGIILSKKQDYYNLFFRRYIMSSFLQETIKEEKEEFSNDDLFNINSWGADLSFRELIAMYDENDLVKPTLQRKYVWTMDEASRLIDSILLGLPIPSIFLAKKEDKRLIIDGYQRIKTVYDFVNGIFSKNGKIFKLSNSKIINERWRGKTFLELTEDEQRRIKNTTIHAIIFEQKKPNNDSGMYQIFERINTSGRTLCSQEIRNCIYQGKYNELLMELNRNSIWRKILNCEEDPRMSDVENILRYFAIKNLSKTEEFSKNQINLKKYLNDNMSLKCNLSDYECNKYKFDFINTIEKVYDCLGITAFNNVSEKKDEQGNWIYSNQFVNKFHPTIYEAIMLSFNFALRRNLNFDNMQEKQLELLNDIRFKEAATIRTTNLKNIKMRVELATMHFFGEEYEWE